MQYGWRCSHLLCELFLTVPFESVRLGKSGLKVSKIIIGCMSYGTPEWQKWVLNEEEGIKQIKFAYVRLIFCLSGLLVDIDSQIRARHPNFRHRECTLHVGHPDWDNCSSKTQVYSNGQSEIVLGKAIKQLNLPRDEIVVMTKVYRLCKAQPHDLTRISLGIWRRRSRAWFHGIRKARFG